MTELTIAEVTPNQEKIIEEIIKIWGGIAAIYFIMMTDEDKISLFTRKSEEYAQLDNDIKLLLLPIIREILMASI